MYRRILVPLDQSTTSQRGLQEAIQLAKAFDASLVLLHVVEYFPMMADMTGTVVLEQVATQMRTAGQQLLQRAHEAARSAGVASETHLEDVAAARVCDVVVQHAQDHRCDLIVMGTHGRRGVEHALLGSDAERVLRQAPCAVLVVRTPALK
jgi:nucleotide-binding universal stress UspA family protein